MPEEIIKMSKREINRLKVIQRVLDKQIKQKDAATKLSLSVRHIRRLTEKIIKYGDSAIAHGNRGRPSNRKYPDEFKNRVTAIVKKNYRDFGPTLAAEKLEERDGIELSRETLRNWMIEKKHLDTPQDTRQR